MEINYWEVSLFIILMISLIVWLIRRNRKDEQTFEKELIQSELKPEENKKKDDPDQL
jgi:hypothetical protein